MSKVFDMYKHELELHGLQDVAKATFVRLMTNTVSIRLGHTHGEIPLADTVLDDLLSKFNPTFAEQRIAEAKSNNRLVFTGGSILDLKGAHTAVLKYEDLPVYVVADVNDDGSHWLSTYYYVDAA